MVIYDLSVLDGSLTGKRFTTKTKQLTKCCEPLRKMRVRLCACKIDLRSIYLYYQSFQGDTSVVILFVICFGVEFLCCLNLMYVFIVLVQFG